MDAYIYKVYFLSNYIDLNNYKEPLIYYYQRITNLFNEESYTVNHLNFNTVKLNTHNGIIFDKSYDIYSYSYIANEKLSHKRSENNDFIYGSFYFWIQNTQQTYTRKYKMIQDICGSIAGIIRIIVALANFFNILFHNFAIYKDLNMDISLNYKSLSNKILKSSFLNSQKFNFFENNKTKKTIKNNYINSNYNISNNSNNIENSNNYFITNKK